MRESTRRLARDYSLAIALAVTVALGIRFFLLEAYRIPTPAMRPTLEPGDTIFVAKWPFGSRFPGMAEPFRKGRAPERGEVIVFTNEAELRRDYIKRVIAVAGDSVEIRKGRLSLNGKALGPQPGAGAACGREELAAGASFPICWEPPALEDYGPQKIPEGSVFVIGDLRTQGAAETRGARGWGVIPISSIKGKAIWTWLSIEPKVLGESRSYLPKLRTDRMFRRIE